MTQASVVALSMPEEHLIARCSAGDLEAFGQVYRLYEEQIFRHAFFLLGDAEDAHDVRQETFLRAYRSFSTFRAQSSLLTWLLRICGNLCHDRSRQRQRRAEVQWDPRMLAATQAAAREASHPADALLLAETLQRIFRVLQALPAPQRRMVVLYLIEERSCPEIAQILGSKVGATRMRVLRAVRLFRERVRAAMEEEN